jgi:hypothetical protein
MPWMITICQCKIRINLNKWDDIDHMCQSLPIFLDKWETHDCLPLLFSAHLRDYQPVNHSQVLRGDLVQYYCSVQGCYISYFVIGVDNYKYVYEGSFTNIAQRQTTIIINYGTGCTLFAKFKGPTVTAETRHRSPWLLLNYSLAFATPQAGWSGPQTTAHQLKLQFTLKMATLLSPAMSMSTSDSTPFSQYHSLRPSPTPSSSSSSSSGSLNRADEGASFRSPVCCLEADVYGRTENLTITASRSLLARNKGKRKSQE